jgi:hypothetical protein
MTDRREEIARLIAYWHGAKITVVRQGRALTVAAQRGYDSGWHWEIDRYVDAHWKEYLPAAEAVISFMEPDYVG